MGNMGKPTLPVLPILPILPESTWPMESYGMYIYFHSQFTICETMYILSVHKGAIQKVTHLPRGEGGQSKKETALIPKAYLFAAKLRTYGIMLSVLPCVRPWTGHKNSHIQPLQRTNNAMHDLFYCD